MSKLRKPSFKLMEPPRYLEKLKLTDSQIAVHDEFSMFLENGTKKIEVMLEYIDDTFGSIPRLVVNRYDVQTIENPNYDKNFEKYQAKMTKYLEQTKGA